MTATQLDPQSHKPSAYTRVAYLHTHASPGQRRNNPPVDPHDLGAYLASLIPHTADSLRSAWDGSERDGGGDRVINAARAFGLVQAATKWSCGSKWVVGYTLTATGRTYLKEWTHARAIERREALLALTVRSPFVVTTPCRALVPVAHYDRAAILAEVSIVCGMNDAARADDIATAARAGATFGPCPF